MLCPFCNYEFSNAIAEKITIIDGLCPSSCDDKILISLLCPSCGRKAWAKTIRRSYATWDEWPDWVDVIKFDEFDRNNPDAQFEKGYWLEVDQQDGQLKLYLNWEWSFPPPFPEEAEHITIIPPKTK